jgi:hypothetical protein
MTIDFKTLKSNSKGGMANLIAELEKQNAATHPENDDNRFWRPSGDKAGNGYAVIRFLPATTETGLPWIKFWDHGFQGPGGWYIERNLNSLDNQPDPVSEYNMALWATGSEANKEIVRKQKRRLHYVSNVYIISDPANPENDGQVKLFKYGKKIFDKINEAMRPEFPDEKPINPFDLWEGANFIMKIRNVEGYRNYDRSEFADPSPLADSEKKMEKIFAQCHDIYDYRDNPKFYKSYAELKAKLYRVLGKAPVVETTTEQQPNTVVNNVVSQQTAKKSTRTASKADDDDDEEAFFQNLAKKAAEEDDDE